MLKEIEQWFINNNWKEGKDQDYDKFNRLWYKRFDCVRPTCYHNYDKPGIQIIIKYWDFRIQGYNHESFEIELIGETKDGEWVDLKCYSLDSNHFIEKADNQIKKLIAAWGAIDNV